MRNRFGTFGCALVGLLLVAVWGACTTGGFGAAELPPESIAVRYWSEADARSRLEIEEGFENRARGPVRDGVARFDDIRELVQGGTLVEGLDEYPGQLVLVDPRSGRITPVQGAPRGAQPLAWSSDRSRLLFAAARRDRNRYGLFEYLIGSGEVRPVVPAGAEESHPRGDYGPDGAVAYSTFEVGRTPEPGLWVRPSRGKARQIARVFAETLRWSPRDDLLVVGERSLDSRSRGSRAWRILAFPIGGGTAAENPPAELLAGEPRGSGRHPTFSPDGAWIVYSAPAGAGWRLQRMRPDGSARSPVGRGIPSRNEQMPSVSPDGRYVAFVADEGGLARLFVRSMDGSNERFVIGHGAVSVPVW